MIYLYAIIEQPGAPLGALRGLDDAPLHSLSKNGLEAVVSSVAPSSLAPMPERLWQHEKVVEALMVHGSVLPARFSTTFPDEAAVTGPLDAFHEQYAGNLERLRGCVEVSIRVVRMIAPTLGAYSNGSIECPKLLPSQQNGRTYEMARKAAQLQRAFRQRSQEGLAEMLHRSLAAFSVDQKLRLEPGPGMLVKAAFLVEQSRLCDIRQAVQRMRKDHTHLHFLCTGPWPPYSFGNMHFLSKPS